MTPKLYTVIGSPPARSVRMVAKRIGLNLELENVDLSKGKHLEQEFLKINPQHTVPVLVEEDGFILWDSHAIMPYIVSKYGKDDSLYPKDLRKRALVDQRLHFESGVLWAKILLLLRPVIYFGQKRIPQASKDAVIEAYEFLEKFLEGRDWIAGDTITIADYSIFSPLSGLNADVLVPVDPERFPNITAWMKTMNALPEAQETQDQAVALQKLMEGLLEK